MKANQSAITRDEEAVTDVLGTILMVGITVGMMVGLSILILNFDGPTPRFYADLQFDIGPGDYSWGDGNEQVFLRHLGGESIPSDDLVIRVSINGVTTTYDGATAGGDLADGTFGIGDTWSALSLTIPVNATVETDVISTSLNQVVGSNALIADLSLAAAAPPLETYVSEYYINGAGTVSAFSNAQSANDGGAVATLAETSSPGSSVTSGRISPRATAAQAGTTDGANTWTSDGLDATLDQANEYVSVTDFGLPNDIATISAVRIGFEAAATGGGSKDPVMRLSYSSGLGSDPSPADFAVVGNSDLTYETTITGDHAWTTADLKALVVTVTRQSASSSFHDADIDHIYMEVDYQQGTQWDLDVMLNFSSVPAGNVQELQVRYAATHDNYTMQIWDGGAWGNTRVLASDTSSLVTVSLTQAEYFGGNPRIRFMDTDDDAGQGTLEIDYAKVISV